VKGLLEEAGLPGPSESPQGCAGRVAGRRPADAVAVAGQKVPRAAPATGNTPRPPATMVAAQPAMASRREIGSSPMGIAGQPD
jgi:hypothetical protein